MKVLFIGDIMGKPGRGAVRQLLPELVDRHRIDLAIANCENACGGTGIVPDVADELFSWGVHALTSGNHIWQKKEIYPRLDADHRILRPENFPRAPGTGHTVVTTAAGVKVGLLNLLGRVYMPQLVDDPFAAAERVVAEFQAAGVKVSFVDIHAEATSEKLALARYLEGRVSAVVGTHTHVQTSDEEVLPGGTARICDAGMTGPHDSVIGMKAELVLERFLTQRHVAFEVARNGVRLEGVVIDIDEETGRARSIERVRERLPDR